VPLPDTFEGEDERVEGEVRGDRAVARHADEQRIDGGGGVPDSGEVMPVVGVAVSVTTVPGAYVGRPATGRPFPTRSPKRPASR